MLIIRMETEQKDGLQQCADIIKDGGTVAFPTETVYGLGANALDVEAVKKIFEAKGRPGDNPLIVHVYCAEQIPKLVKSVPENAKQLMQRFWPGPLTLIMEKSDAVPYEVTAGLDTVAVRFPKNPVARQFLELCGLPVAAPSANRSGRPSPTKASHVIEDLYGRIDAVIDGGDCDYGLESTVLDVSGEVPILLRPGSVTYEQLCEVLGEVEIGEGVSEKPPEGVIPRSPGMKYTHYSPNADVIVVSGQDENVELYINHQIEKHHKMGHKVGVMVYQHVLPRISGADVLLTLGDRNHRSNAASVLFSHLRRFEQEGADVVFAQDCGEQGIGLAISNRLNKAAGYEIIELG